MRGSRADEAFDRAFPDLFRAAREIAYRILGDHHAADAVAAEAMAGAYARWRRLRSPVNATGWAVRRAADIAIDAAPAPGTLEPEVLNEALGPALAALPRPQALAVALRYLSTLGPAQVATALRRTRAQVDSDVATALPRLARQLGAFADELPATTPMEAIPSRSDTTKVLGRVHARGQYLRRQPVTFVLFLVLAGMLAAGIAGVARHHDSSSSHLRLTASPTSTLPPTTAVTAAPPTTVPAPTSSVVAADTSTTVDHATTTAPHATTTVCRNSMSASCGAFRWDPPPGDNQPVTVTATYFPSPPHPYEPLTFSVRSNDPDDEINTNDRCRTVNSWGDGSSDPQQPDCPRCPTPGRYGPWTPPAKNGGSHVDYPAHTFPPGDYTVTFRRVSGDPCPDETDPYASEGTVSIAVHVPQPSPNG
jgi:DNA-directed RNA polymerase specialized sigma24 family protein